MLAGRQLKILVALEHDLELILAGVPSGLAEVHQVPPVEAPAALALRSYDVIISRWTDEWNRWIELNNPAPRFVHLGSPPASLLTAAGFGAAVHACSNAAQLAAVLDELRGPERNALRQAPAERFEVRLGGVAVGLLVDFSNTGLSVCVPFGNSLSGLGTDHLITGLELFSSSGRRLLGPASLRIARVHASREGYVLGLTFEPDAEPAALSPRSVTDPTRIMALLAAGVRHHGLKVRAHDAPQVTVTLREGMVDASGTVFESPESLAPLPPLSVVDVEFEVTAIQCSFTGLLLEASPARLQVPKRIIGVERRISERRPVAAPSTLRFEHPLLKQRVEVPVADVSVDGIGVEFETDGPPLPPGLDLDGATLHIGPSAFAIQAQSRRVPRLEGDRWRTGFRLEFVRPADGTEFARAWIALEFPKSEIEGTTDAGELVDFLLKTRIAPASVDRTAATDVLNRLHQVPPRLHWSLYCREGGQLIAAVNGIRRYPRTFTFQHFALGRPDRDLANLMVRVTVEMTLHDQSVQFIHCNYAKSNHWSARFFGSGVAGVDDPDRSSIAQREILFLRGVPSVEANSLQVRAPTDGPTRALAEGLIAKNEPVFLMQAHAWQARDWLFEQLTEEWRACGLQREREVFAAWDGDELLGVSIAELSSPAMNLREDLSAARLWLAPGLTAARRAAATGSLVTALGTFYAQAGRKVWPLIFTPSADDAWLAAAAVERVGFAEVMVRRDAGQAISQVWAAIAVADQEKGKNVRANKSGSTTP